MPMMLLFLKSEMGAKSAHQQLYIYWNLTWIIPLKKRGGVFCFPIRDWTARNFTGRVEDDWGQPQYVFYPSIPHSDPNLL